MKKKGFTVAEILITLGIIGVVASLTIPAVTQSAQRKVYANSLSAAVSDFENAMTAMLMQEGAYMLQSTPAWKDGFMENLKLIFPYNTDDIGTKARFNLNKTTGSAINGTYTFFSNNGVMYSVTLNTSNKTLSESEIMSKGGALTSVAADVLVDINGPKKPNMWGRDTFKYVLGSEGHLYPYGGKDWAIYNGKTYTSTTTKTECVTNKKGDYCAAYLAENGYNMDY